MKNKKAERNKNSKPSTQRYIPFAEIREGTVIMKDGTLRAIMMVSSINFALKNEDEQTAIISAYVSFLNGIDFPLQIVIQSRKLYIKPYIEKLIKKEKEQANELLRTQIADYRAFVSELVDVGKIMSKQFYVIVPYDPLSNKKASFWSRAGDVINPAKIVRIKEKRFKERKRDLEMRVRQVVSGLSQMNLEVVRLDTQSLLELYYSTYNPDIALAEYLPSIEKIQVEQQ